MPLANDKVRYGAISRALHWLTLILVIVLLVTGKAGGMEAGEPGNQSFMWHGSLGVIILLLTVVRVIWIIASPPPPLPAEVSYPFRAAAVASHVVLYSLLLVLPVSGWLAASEEGAAINFFNVAALPLSNAAVPSSAAPSVPVAGVHEHEQDVGADRASHEESASQELHETLGNVLLILALLHALAAILHHFVGRNGMLLRMLPATKGKRLA